MELSELRVIGTSHVPCKFYPLGTCQAGSACQFSHDLDTTVQNAPCKYFAKGSCKFGQSCALAHILPDGRVINRPPRGASGGYRRGPMNGPMPGPQSSLLSMQAQDPMMQQGSTYVYPPQEAGNPAYTHQPGSPIYQSHVYPSETGSPYGSPPGDLRFGASPPRGGLSVLDAPLPSSFDSQGISHAARNGPVSSSMPPRFGIESPPSSLPTKAMMGNTALRDLRESAFGESANLDGVLHGLGSSPPTFNEPLTFTKRPLHSERFARPKMTMSTSWDVRPGSHFNMDMSDESSDDGYGEDLLPSSLHELLPTEKLRRLSRPAEDENPSFSLASAQRRAISNGNTPQDSKVGSLSPHSASPSRYNNIWSARPVSKTEQEAAFPSSFGHVGSALRPTNLRSSSLKLSTSPNGTTSSYVGSPTNQGGISMLAKELQRTKLEQSKQAVPAPSHPVAPRVLSNGSGAARNGLGDRGFSSSSLGRERIDEEQGLFSMEEEEGK